MTTLMMLRHAIMSVQDLRVNIKAAISNILGINKVEVDQLPPVNINSTIYSELDITNSSLSLNQVSQINITNDSELVASGDINTVRISESEASLSNTTSISGNIEVKRILNAGTIEEDFSVIPSGNMETSVIKNVEIADIEIELEQNSNMSVSDIISQEATLNEQLSSNATINYSSTLNIDDDIENSILLEPSVELSFYEAESSNIVNNIVLENSVDATSDQSASSITSVSFGIGLTAELESVEPIIPGHEPFITFSSATPFTLSTYNNTKNWDGTLETSTDMYGWNEWDGTSAVSSSNSGKLYVRGDNNMVVSGNYDGRWVLNGSSISVGGDIRNLLKYSSKNNASVNSYALMYLFYGNTALVSAAELQIKLAELSYGCCKYMFSSCSNLTEPPTLPTMTLAESCYSSMFSSCSSLRYAPSLPATALADSCYSGMFSMCYHMTTPPTILPALTLVSGCYKNMFESCHDLASAPELPATTLAKNCYSGMFVGCTALTTAPALLATTLAENCYYNMFSSCSLLTSVPALPATALLYSCYYGMFYGCSNIKLSTAQDSDYTQEYQTIPYGGDTSQTPVSQTNANNMFKGTGGTFTGTPSSNTMYYLHKDCKIVLPSWEDPVQEGNNLSIEQSYVAQQVGSELFIN